MKDKFNRYCAKVIGIYPDGVNESNYNPYDDLNHMADVVEELLERHAPQRSIGGSIRRKGIKQAFRDFIISTMEDNE